MIPYEKQLEQFSQGDKNSLTFIVGDKGLGKLSPPTPEQKNMSLDIIKSRKSKNIDLPLRINLCRN